MAVGKHLIIKRLQEIKAQLPTTITEKDIITTLNLIYMCCNDDKSIIAVINNIAEYYKKQDEKFNDELFKLNLHHALQFIDQDLMLVLRALISHISIYNVFNHHLLWFDFNEFIKNNDMTNTAFLQKKVKVMKSNNISFIKKIESCNDLNKLNKLKKQLDNNFDIFKHFKSVCENYQVYLLTSYNFVANRIKYSLINDNADNGIVLVESEYVKIKEIIAREDRFKKILIVESNNSQLSYKLNIESLILIFKEEMVNLLYEYERKNFVFKKNKCRMTNLRMKCLRLKIQNIFDLSKIIFDVFEKSFELLPLTKMTNEVFDENGSRAYLNEAMKDIDDNIKILEESHKKLNEKLNENSNKKMEEILGNDVKKEPLVKKKGKKKKKNNKKNDNLALSVVASIQVHEATICKVNEIEEVKELEDHILDINVINVIEQVITENDVKVIAAEEFKEDELLKIKINELEKQLQQMEEKLNQTKVKSTEETTILEQQLKTENDSKIKLVEEVKKDRLTIAKLQTELRNVHSKENRRRKENKKSSQQLKKINQELVKEKQALKRSKSENQQLLSEINKLKKTKIKLEKAEQENNNQIKVKAESISLLEKELATINMQQTVEVRRLVKQKNRIIFEKEKLENINKINKEQLMNLVVQLNEKQQILSQCNPNLNAFTDSYHINSCMKVEPVFEQKIVSKTLVVNEVQSVVAPVSILVPTGNKFLIKTESLENIYTGDQLTPGFYLQPKLSSM